MDNDSGLADCSNIFARFLMITRKFGYHCVYIFHVILREKNIWNKIIQKTNILNIFPASVPFQTIMNILQANAVRTATRYLQLDLCG